MSDSLDRWLDELGLGAHAELFRRNDIDVRSLPHLTDADLRELGLSLGHRRILGAAIARLGGDGSAGDTVQRRQLTVMFCDLSDSTALGERLGPEAMREVLRRYQDRVMQAVSRYGGYLARFVGDGALAYFGWPRAFEDQAERAVRAAREIVASIHTLELPGVGRLEVRIGIETGQVVVGDLRGAVARDSQSVTGDTPNLAARLQGLAHPGQIVVGDDTRRLVWHAFALEPLGRHRLKGFRDDRAAYAVGAEIAAETRFAAGSMAAVELVGRDRELQVLRECWRRVRTGTGQVVRVEGEAGIGKSRLLQALADELPQGIAYHLRYQCSAHHRNSAFHPVMQRLRRAAGFHPGDSDEARLDRLEALLSELEPHPRQVAPLFAALLSLPGEERYGPLGLNPQQLRGRIISALLDQVFTLSRRRPVLFLLEDAHWVDPSMHEFMAALLPRVADRPVMVAVTYRPERTPEWAAAEHHTHLDLTRLPPRNAARLATAVAGHELPADVVDGIIDRADGVPLFVEELTRAVVEDPAVDGDGGTRTRADIPVTLQASLVARLDRLNTARDLAQMAATIGRESPRWLLQAAGERTPEALEAALQGLVSSGLMLRHGDGEQERFTFKHALVQDAAYSTLLVSQRRRLHRRIFAALRDRGQGAGGERLEILAHHAFQGELWQDAFVLLRRCGQRAMDRAAIREAIAQYRRALTALSELPETPALRRHDIDLRFALRNALWSIGEFQEILTLLESAGTRTQELGDPARIGWISVYRSASLWQLGRSQEALDAAAAALKINGVARDLSLGIGARFYRGCAEVTAGRYRGAEALFRSISDALTGARRQEPCGLPFLPSVIARSWLVWSLAERGEFIQAETVGAEALRIATDAGHPFNIAHVHYDVGYQRMLMGDTAGAVESLGAAVAIIEEWQLSYLSPFITGFHGHALAMNGDTEAGARRMTRALREYRQMGLGLFRSLIAGQAAEIRLLSGDLRGARTQATEALALARRRGERGHEAWIRWLLGRIALAGPSADPAGASRRLGEALGLAARLGMRPLAAHCHHALGTLPDDLTPEGDAAAHLAQARAAYSDMEILVAPRTGGLTARGSAASGPAV